MSFSVGVDCGDSNVCSQYHGDCLSWGISKFWYCPLALTRDQVRSLSVDNVPLAVPSLFDLGIDPTQWTVFYPSTYGRFGSLGSMLISRRRQKT